jgi:hypothetical protein
MQNAHSGFNRKRVTTGNDSALAANYGAKRLSFYAQRRAGYEKQTKDKKFSKNSTHVG